MEVKALKIAFLEYCAVLGLGSLVKGFFHQVVSPWPRTNVETADNVWIELG